jgi:hypothetical protein
MILAVISSVCLYYEESMLVTFMKQQLCYKICGVIFICLFSRRKEIVWKALQLLIYKVYRQLLLSNYLYGIVYSS